MTFEGYCGDLLYKFWHGVEFLVAVFHIVAYAPTAGQKHIIFFVLSHATYVRRFCVSHAGNASKLMTAGSCGFHRWVAQRLISDTNFHAQGHRIT